MLGKVQLAIKAFEGVQVDPLKLLDSLVSLIKSVSSRVLNPCAKVDVLNGPIDGWISPKPYLGYVVESKAAELPLVPEDEYNVWKRCVAFTISLTNELRVTVLSLPHSNAEVRRVFSQMCVVKAKLRNRISLQTLNSVQYIRYGLKLSGDVDVVAWWCRPAIESLDQNDYDTLFLWASTLCVCWGGGKKNVPELGPDHFTKFSHIAIDSFFYCHFLVHLLLM